MAGKLGHVLLALLRAIDILACAVWLAPLYLVGLADRPTGREMISSYVGESASNGHEWGVIAASIIDWCANVLGGKPGHCRRSFEYYRDLDNAP